jgi:hypothetical protein
LSWKNHASALQRKVNKEKIYSPNFYQRKLSCDSQNMGINDLAVAAVPLFGRDIYVKIKKQANQKTFFR